jgi:hypothetical protein
MRSADIAAELTNVRGTGCWSAAMFLMFHLRRLDVWPTGYFSVRAGYAPAWGIAVPTPKALDGPATCSGPTAASSSTPPAKSRPTRICSRPAL